MVASLRIVLVTGEYPPAEGGVADYTRCLATALAAHGATVHVVTGRAGHGSIDADRPRGVTVHRVMPGWSWSNLQRLRSMANVLMPDFLHVQFQAAAFDMRSAILLAPWYLRNTATTRTAITYHDLRTPYLFPKAGRLRSWMTMLPARQAHLTVATNAADHAVLDVLGKTWRLALVPIGSNIPDNAPADYDRAAWRAATGVAQEEALLLWFGFVNESKGGQTLLDALATLRDAGRAARLVHLGGAVGASDATNQASADAFDARAADLGVQGLILRTGHVDPATVSAWMHAADVVVMPYADGASYRRGTLLAALTHGRPIVTTHAPEGPADHVAGGGGLPPLIDGVNARLVAPGDGRAVAGAVAGILDDASLAATLAAGARDLAGVFGWPAIAAKHIALYDEIRATGAESGL